MLYHYMLSVSDAAAGKLFPFKILLACFFLSGQDFDLVHHMYWVIPGLCVITPMSVVCSRCVTCHLL